jgi:hypothetical protein
MTAASSPDRGGCSQLAPELVTAYARNVLDSAQHGAVGEAAAWSVEAHLPDCAACRSALAAELEPGRLERSRSLLLTRLALQPGPAGRAFGRCGVPEHMWRLLSVTPSLRRSWLAGVALVLGAAIGAARLAAVVVPAAGDAGGRPGLPPTPVMPGSLLPFLILAPLLPLSGVAAAFHSRLDPAADLATAAPVSDVWLFCVRAVAVIASALIPTMLVALLLPGSKWLPLLVVLPALAVSAAALALATVTGPLPAAIGAGAAWVAVVVGLASAAGAPELAYGGAAQAACLAVIVGSCCLLAARRRTLTLRWIK